jgi:hypothetical protein
MKILLIAVEPTSPARSYPNLGDKLKEKGEDCQTMDSVWCLKTNRNSQEIFDYLRNGIVHPLDRLLVAKISDPWLCQNTRNQGDCFDLNP